MTEPSNFIFFGLWWEEEEMRVDKVNNRYQNGWGCDNQSFEWRYSCYPSIKYDLFSECYIFKLRQEASIPSHDGRSVFKIFWFFEQRRLDWERVRELNRKINGVVRGIHKYMHCSAWPWHQSILADLSRACYIIYYIIFLYS